MPSGTPNPSVQQFKYPIASIHVTHSNIEWLPKLCQTLLSIVQQSCVSCKSTAVVLVDIHLFEWIAIVDICWHAVWRSDQQATCILVKLNWSLNETFGHLVSSANLVKW